MRAMNARGLYRYVLDFSRMGNWVECGRRLFDVVLREGGVWHIFGHSWEIAELGLWGDLERLLDYIAGREGVLYLSNGETLRSLCQQHRHVNGSGLASMLKH